MHYTSEKEKLIRKAARARIRSVPQLLEVWKQQRSPVTERLSVLIGLLFSMFFFVGFPAGMAQSATDGGEIDWPSLLGVSLISLAVCVGLANWFLNELTESALLGVSSLLPVADASLVRHLTLLYCGGAAISFAPAAGFWGMAAWSMTNSWTAVGLALLLAAAQVVVHAAIGLIAAMWIRTWCHPAVLLALILLGLLAAFGISFAEEQGMPNIDAALRPMIGVLPTGWSLMCLIEAVLNDSGAGWWYLVPIGILLPLAVLAANQLADSYRIIEFDLLEGATARVHDVRGLSRPVVAYEFEVEEEVERPLTELRAQVRSREFLTTDPEQHGMIERMFYDMLSDEERRSVDVLTGGEIINMTSRVTVVAVTVVILASAAIILDAWLVGFGGLSIIGVAGWLTTVLLLARPEASMLKDRSMLHCGTASLLPVDWPRLQRVINLAAVLQGVFLLPLSLLISGFGLWAMRGHLPWLEAISLGFKPLLIFVAAHQFWMQFLIPLDPKGDRVLADTKQGFDLLFCIAFLVGAVAIFVVDFDSIWSLVATGILFGAGWLHRRYFFWMILKRHTELVALPTEVETTPGMSR